MGGLVAERRQRGRGGRSTRHGEVPRRRPELRANEPAGSLRVLLLVSAHDTLSQSVWIALTALGHEVTLSVVDSAAAMEAAVGEHCPELIVCPMLTQLIPESIWSQHRCLIVHPGPVGDRGPSSLDWAIALGAREWGVTIVQANGELGAGEVWARRTFRMREAGKSSLYRHEVRRAAIEALVEAVGQIADGAGRPVSPDANHRAVIGVSPDANHRAVIGRPRPLMTQPVRAIDWDNDRTETVIRKLHAGEGHPGVLDTIAGSEFYLFGAHREPRLRGVPGEIIATRTGAVCRASPDGAVWITHLKRRDTATERFFKLPATHALACAGHTPRVREIPAPVHADARDDHGYREIAYEERAGVGYLRFEFYNGAMSTEQCLRLLDAYRYARARKQTRVIVLLGGGDFFSNGVNLNVIEAAPDPATESWRNLHAINDLVREIITTGSRLVVSALAGDVSAGGVPLALAADHVIAREDVVLNPHYQHMGGLYGSEYWTYLLPRRVGADVAARLVSAPLTPIGAHEGVRIGLLDAAFGATLAGFRAQTRRLAEQLARDPGLPQRLAQKRRQRARDEQAKPLHVYRNEELARSHECFLGPDRCYHTARRRFVYHDAG
jgi:putative two-component system hydrogenase maturation factor HypX/HoxX